MLPKGLAIEYQRYDLDKVKSKLEYYQSLVNYLQERYNEGYQELQRLQE